MKITIVDYAGGMKVEHGPYVSVRFAAVNTTFPKIQEDTISFYCEREEDEGTDIVTVGLLTHTIVPHN